MTIADECLEQIARDRARTEMLSVARCDPGVGFDAIKSNAQDSQQMPPEQLLAMLRQANAEDGLDVAEDELLHHHRTESWRMLLPAAYATGYAAALGYEITVSEFGDRVLIGARPDASLAGRGVDTDRLGSEGGAA